MTSASLTTANPGSAIATIAVACGQPMATTTSEVIEQAIAYLAGVYGALYQPALNAVFAWHSLLAGATVDEIAAAVVAHVADSGDGGSGAPGRFPPTPADLLRRIADARRRRRERQRERERWEERCMRWARDPQRAFVEGRNCFHADGTRMSDEEIRRAIDHGRALLRARGEVAS
jgi:hypothetical protein